MRTSENIDQIGAALAKAQGALSNVSKDKTAKAGRYSYSYANIADVLELIREVASTNGLAYVQSAEPAESLLVMTCRLIHESGQWLEVYTAAEPGDWSPQAVGSCETYLRRYQLIKVFAVAAEDDDGAKAQQAVKTRAARHPAQAGEMDRQMRALWARVGNAAKAEGLTRDVNGVTKGDYRALARKVGVNLADDYKLITAADLQSILDARPKQTSALDVF
tara:strand:+ start:3421 stop:4080 length:660 start_codon:yes stop_codon:yes gene_type:complete